MSSLPLTWQFIATLPEKQRTGSRPRCIGLTAGTDAEVFARLDALVSPYQVDRREPAWVPRGTADIRELTLAAAEEFLDADRRERLRSWWLAATGKTPTWDLIAKISLDGQPGLLLVEAKAHASELKERDAKALAELASDGQRANHDRMAAAVDEASQALASLTGLAWDLSLSSHYQLANRFAWAWKLAAIGIPVVLVYLGFLGAREMSDAFETEDDWRNALLAYSRSHVPAGAWERPIQTQPYLAPFIPVIRTARIDLPEKPA